MYTLFLQLHPGLDHPDRVHQRVSNESWWAEEAYSVLHCSVTKDSFHPLNVTQNKVLRIEVFLLLPNSLKGITVGSHNSINICKTYCSQIDLLRNKNEVFEA